MIEYHQQAEKLLRETQQMHLDYNPQGDVEFIFNGVKMSLPQKGDACTIEMFAYLWSYFLVKLNNRFENIIYDFLKKNKESFN